MDGNDELSASPEVAEKEEPSEMKPRLRHATVYDAVAGRVSTGGFIAQPSRSRNDGNPQPFSSKPLTPEEVLFRRLNAPVRYMEDDFYFANEALPPERPLPDSDLLKAIHAYSSDFYTHSTLDRGRTSWRSMDETALIAMGILLEEAAKESLGETGDMVFVEGEEMSDAESAVLGRKSATPKPWVRKRADTASSGGFGGREDDLVRFRQRTRRKRRRVRGSTADQGELDTVET